MVNTVTRESAKAAAIATKKYQHGLASLTRYQAKDSKFLGKNKAGENYAAQIQNSMTRYRNLQQKRHNLFAFIMPAGHGKTTLSHRYGFVDVDELITKAEHDKFADTREAILNGMATWGAHNLEWYARLNQTLDLLDYTMPVIILVHTEELALELGARPIGRFKLDRKVFLKNIERRDALGKHFSKLNYDTLVTSPSVPNQLICKSNEELEQAILHVLNLSNMPVACPHKYRTDAWNGSYHRSVPGWVLRGERTGDRELDINELRRFFEMGMVPKECVDYYARHSYVPSQFDFGITMFEWSQALAHLPPTFKSHVDFDTRADMVEVFPPQSAKELSRANITMRHLVQTFDIFDHPDAYEIAAKHVGEPHVFVTSILSAWKGITQKTSVADVVYPWFATSYRNWSDRMKSLHSYIRCSRFIMNREITEEDRQSLMYMDLLVGRGEYSIDEMAEVDLRQSDTYEAKHLSYDPDAKLYTNEQYKKDFIKGMGEAHMRIKNTPKAINVTSFISFYKRRSTWLTKGGLVSNKMPKGMKEFTSSVYDSVHALVEEIQGRHNKKSLFEVHELYDILQGADETNFNITKTMIKYEVGRKDRTLLPGTLVHFIVFSYVLLLAEKQEQIGSVRLNAAPDADIRYFDRKMGSGVFHVLYDWADFNEQHSAWEMAQVIIHLRDRMPQGQDYAMFCDALIQGMYSMGLEDKEGMLHKLWRGLYSGWRGTTWINTCLNFVYIWIALQNLMRLTGQSVVLMVDHGGDDVDLMLSQPALQPIFMEIMDDMLFKANKWKQMFGLRSEFFRNTICGARVFASPIKGLAGFIAGDWEGAGRATVRERVVGLLDQISKLKRRGLDNVMAQGFTMATISHWCKVKDGEEWLNLPPVVIHGRVEQNGLGVPDKYNKVWVLEDDVPVINEEWYKVVVPDYKASKDYVKVLSDELERFSLVIERQGELAQKLAKDSYNIDLTIDRMEWKRLLNFSTRVLDEVDVVEPMEDDVIFEDFTTFEISPEVEKLYGRASRYQEYIGYITHNNQGMTKEKLVNLMSDGQVSVETIEFSGDMYYQRLIPEFINVRALMYCRVAINSGALDLAGADYVYKVICWMSARIFGHMM